MKPALRTLFVLAAIAAAVRLFAMTFLHPLNWDEVEYFRATDWVRQGLVPFRDFWEHHTPLQWFLFAPFAALTDSPGAAAIIFMRWMQVPLWIAAFWLINRLMQQMELDAVARWCAITLAVASSLLMSSAIEYRVDALANVLYLGGLAAAMPSPRVRGEGARRADEGLLPAKRAFVAGALLALTVFANLRLAPLVAVTVLLSRSWRLVAGAIITGLGGLLYFVATDSLQPLYQQVWVDNYVGEKLAERVPYAFLHRILVPFGLGIYGGASGVIDLAGAAVIVLGVIGLATHWRGPLFILAILQVVNVLFLIRMKFVYHYHLQIAVLLMLPFVAAAIERLASWRRAVVVYVGVAVVGSVAIVLLRGKEFDLRYQDRIMREVHAHTAPGAKVFDGVGWAIRREPAYRFWFLPVLARQLVASGEAAPYSLADWITDPPAAVITDRNAKVWLAMHPDLRSYVEHHYLPLWRDLWLPALSGRFEAGGRLAWIVPADGRYRIVAGPDVRRGPQFRATPRGAHLLEWTVDGVAVQPRDVLELRRGSRVDATSATAVNVFLVPGEETVWFRQPPPGVTIDAELPRVWHVPFSAPTPISSARP